MQCNYSMGKCKPAFNISINKHINLLLMFSQSCQEPFWLQSGTRNVWGQTLTTLRNFHRWSFVSEKWRKNLIEGEKFYRKTKRPTIWSDSSALRLSSLVNNQGGKKRCRGPQICYKPYMDFLFPFTSTVFLDSSCRRSNFVVVLDPNYHTQHRQPSLNSKLLGIRGEKRKRPQTGAFARCHPAPQNRAIFHCLY